MNQSLAYVAIVVGDYDEAIAFYVGTLGFELVEDTALPDENKRWVVVKPRGDGNAALLLARAANARQQDFVGDQTGGRVFLFLRTDNFWRDFHMPGARGVTFVREPKQASYGTVAVFKDLYGNLWDLLQLARDDDRRDDGLR